MTVKDRSKFAEKSGTAWVTAKPADLPDGVDDRQGVAAEEAGWVYGFNVTMPELIPLLGRKTGRPIVDQTGVTSRFSFSVTYDLELTRPGVVNQVSPGDIAVPGDIRPPNEIKSLLSVLEREAGIKLELSKQPVDVLVIDHIEKPSEN
ncbi:MAG TPA: TIGR03435 family protein [Terriglobia bacterium]|jgi:uncharacterized protein (TIGR03435 family)